MPDNAILGHQSPTRTPEWAGVADVAVQCPECGKGPLQIVEDTASCAACQKGWPVQVGVPLLCRRQHDTYQADELSVPAANRLIAEAPVRGWRPALATALETLPRGQAEYLERYVCSQTRALLLDLLDLGEDAIVLDHGCGWGNMSFHLAQRVQRVVAMDLVGQRARFTAIRAALEGLPNVQPVVSGDYERLPFPDNTFDAVNVNGVLEWVPCSLPGNPQAIQEKRLREVFRILKPGGQLLLAIENRYWFQYLLGVPEVHSGVKWASLVPCWAANFLARAQGRGEFRTYTYSLRGLQRLLGRNGFTGINPFVTLPEYNFPQIVVPAYDRAAMLHALDRTILAGGRRKRLIRLAARVGLYPHVAYCFAVVCRKEPV